MWDARLYQLQQQIAWQSGKILELEGMIKELMNRVDKIGVVPQTRIDRIEYQFDQLKVEKLEGALHIGISPPGMKDLMNQWQGGSKEAFDVQWADAAGASGAAPAGNGNNGDSGDSGPFPGGAVIQPAGPGGGGEVRGTEAPPMADAEPYRSVDRFMTDEVPRVIDHYAKAFRLPLDSDYRTLMTRSLRGQIGERLNYYLSLAGGEVESAGPINLEQIADKVKRDVETAIRTHLEEMRKPEEERSHESASGE